uniref:Serine hydrolase like n=1 Tax=Oreochromis niloticus TaxID=8128 RepID=I3KNK6_ORENI
MPGHGLSSHRPPGVFYSFPEYAADVRRVTESLSWTKFSIMGHSMGGNIAVMFSALYPDMVDGIVVLDVFGFVPTDPKEIPRIMRQGMDEMLKYEKKAEEEKKRVYTYEKAVERLLAANPTLSERSVQMLLERGLTRVEGGFVFSRDLRVNFKNIERITLEQSLAMQSMIQAPVLLILADKGFGPASRESSQKLTSKLLQVYQERNSHRKPPGMGRRNACGSCAAGPRRPSTKRDRKGP